MNEQILDDIIFDRPLRIVSSAWLTHVPFAFFIIKLLKPRLLVELGTHNGASYSAFCQTVMKLNLDTACYAVDTWKGDEQASFYSEDVYKNFKEFNDTNYKSFSYLMRMTFEEAKEQFSDGSIDLLHIDGLHTYEAVSKDYSDWLCKLSSRGVVIFHDITERRKTFGVWKLWEEIKTKYTTLEFFHGHGLGVAFVGKDIEEDKLLIVKEINENRFYKNMFYSAGTLIEQEYIKSQELLGIENIIEKKNQEIEKKNQEIEKKNQEIEKQNQEIINLRSSFPYKLGRALLFFPIMIQTLLRKS